jgi:tetratricopeptide (TPR) repeat protein
MWVRRQRWDEAAADLRRAIGLRPDAYQGYVNLALACQGRKDWDGAVRALDQALRLRPRDARLYHTRARLHRLRHDPAQARHDFEQAIACTPRGSKSERLAGDLVELAHLQHQAKDYQAALASCDAALAAWHDYPPAYRQRAEALLALGKDAEAGRDLDRYLAKGPPMAQAWEARGLIHQKFREYPLAIEAFSRALGLRRDAATLDYRGWVYLKLDALALALPDFEAALAVKPADADARCGRALVRARLGKVSAAVDDVDAALRAGPRTTRLLLRAACVYARAAGQLEAARHGSPGPSPDVYHDQDHAVALLRAALEQVPAGQRSAFWRDYIRGDKDLVPLRHTPGMLDLAGRYAREAASEAALR